MPSPIIRIRLRTGSAADAYGRFDLAHAAALKTRLNPATAPASTPEGGLPWAHRCYNAKTNAHLCTTSAAERDQVMQTLRDFNFEGVAYHVWSAP